MHDSFSLPRSRWIALLSIAHRYEFENVRARAIREIYDPLGKRDKIKSSPDPGPDPEPPDYLVLILTAEKYNVPLERALPAYIGLVMRKDPLTQAEIVRSSALTVHRLASAREEYLRTRDYVNYDAAAAERASLFNLGAAKTYVNYGTAERVPFNFDAAKPYVNYGAAEQNFNYHGAAEQDVNYYGAAERIVRKIWPAAEK